MYLYFLKSKNNNNLKKVALVEKFALSVVERRRHFTLKLTPSLKPEIGLYIYIYMDKNADSVNLQTNKQTKQPMWQYFLGRIYIVLFFHNNFVEQSQTIQKIYGYYRLQLIFTEY